MNDSTRPAEERRIRRTRAQWQQVIIDYENDNLTQKEFCAKHNLGSVSFNKWYHRLKHQAQDSGFVALVTPSSGMSNQSVTTTEKVGGFEVRLELGDGLILHLSRQ